MENQVRASSLNAETGKVCNTWIVSSVFDLLFLANLGWFILLLPGVSTRQDTPVDFWQIYFLTVPHRWITFVILLADPSRRGGRGWLLAGIGGLLALLVSGVYCGAGTFLCLGILDYTWNAWHFASQHAGVLRIYSKKVGGGIPSFEKWGTRIFITYSILRASSAITGLTEYEWLSRFLPYVDLALLGVPSLLIFLNLWNWQSHRIGKLAYLLSVCALYCGYLFADRWAGGWLLIFATSASLFHSVEYLAIVTHYASRRAKSGPASAIQSMAKYWFAFLAFFVVTLGVTGVLADQANSWLTVGWQGINLWAALAHYAYDGLIWKLRRPETAKLLGAISPT